MLSELYFKTFWYKNGLKNTTVDQYLEGAHLLYVPPPLLGDNRYRCSCRYPKDLALRYVQLGLLVSWIWVLVRYKSKSMHYNMKNKLLITRLILFSNSEPPRLRDVVSHLITIETTINTHTHTRTHTRTHARTQTHTHTPTHTYKQFTNQRQYIRYFVHVGLSAATHRQFFLRQNIFRAFKNNDQIPDTFRILEKYTEKYT